MLEGVSIHPSPGAAPAWADRRVALVNLLDQARSLSPAGRVALRGRLLDGLEHSGGAERVEQLLLLGVLEHLAGDAVVGALHVEEAARLAEGVADPCLLLRCLDELARRLLELGERSRAYEAASQLLTVAAEHGAWEEEANALVGLGYMHGERDEPVAYAELTSRAIALYRARGNRRGLVGALINLGGALCRLRRFDEALAVYAEAEATCEAQDPLRIWRAALIEAGRGGVCCEQGQFEAGLACYARSARLLEGIDRHYQIARHHLLIAGYLRSADRSAEALVEADAARAIGTAFGYASVCAMAESERSQALEALGDLAGALAAQRAYAAQQGRLDAELAAQRLRAVEARFEVQSARAAAAFERRRRSELEETNAALEAALRRERDLREELLRHARTDALTGIANRRHTEELLGRALAGRAGTKSPLCLALFDVDRFKAINDTFGHGVGDVVLAEVARRAVQAARADDIVGRWGGEELCVAFPNTSIEAASRAADRLRAAIGATPIQTPSGAVRVTISGGLVAVPPGAADLMHCLEEADRALYRAKARGRDQVVVA